MLPSLALVALLGAGCGLPRNSSDSELERQIGIIRSEYLHSPALVAPDTVAAGATFAVTVTTLGYNSCWQAAGADVARDPQRARIVPYDRIVGHACFHALVELPRTVELRFDAPGTATLIVEGRTDGPKRQQETARLLQQIVVR
jgi:hypothetical protein